MSCQAAFLICMCKEKVGKKSQNQKYISDKGLETKMAFMKIEIY